MFLGQRYDDDVSNPPKRARIDEDAPPQQLKTKKSARIDEDASPVATNSKVKRRGIPIPTQPASTSNNPTPARVKDDIWDGLPYIAVVDAKRMERIAELCESNDFGGLRDEVFTGPMKNFIDRSKFSSFCVCLSLPSCSNSRASFFELQGIPTLSNQRRITMRCQKSGRALDWKRDFGPSICIRMVSGSFCGFYI